MVRVVSSKRTVVGSALLAAVGAGVCSDLQEAAMRTTRVVEVNEPVAANRPAYERAYGNFLSVYESLKGCFEGCALS